MRFGYKKSSLSRQPILPIVHAGPVENRGAEMFKSVVLGMKEDYIVTSGF
jgi:hypothetical protein